jgi:hypothetical protein
MITRGRNRKVLTINLKNTFTDGNRSREDEKSANDGEMQRVNQTRNKRHVVNNLSKINLLRRD